MNEKEILYWNLTSFSIFNYNFDQISKWIIASSMKIGDSYEVIPHFLNITSHRNNGALGEF